MALASPWVSRTKNSFGRRERASTGRYDFGPIDVVTEEAFHREFNLNVLAPILAVQKALKYFPETGGSIINISAMTSENPVQNSARYSASKAALDTLTAALAKELGPRRIRVNSVAPGSTVTERTHRIGLAGTKLEKTIAAATPPWRLGQPEDIASLVAFLASDESARVTGERISASGGLHSYRALRDGVNTHPTMAEHLGPLFSEIPERRLRRVKNLIVTMT